MLWSCQSSGQPPAQFVPGVEDGWFLLRLKRVSNIYGFSVGIVLLPAENSRVHGHAAENHAVFRLTAAPIVNCQAPPGRKTRKQEFYAAGQAQKLPTGPEFSLAPT